jgi:predicted peptidase
MNARHFKCLVVLLVIVALIGCSSSDNGPLEPVGKIQNVSAYSKVFDAYHQLAAVVVEYSEEVVAPDKKGYTVVDYITPSLRDDFMRWPISSEAPVAAVYTNSQPAMRADRISVKGKYVVIELAPTTLSLPANAAGVNMLEHSAAMATMRTTAAIDQCDYLRKDWSKLVITQNVDVKNASGYIVAEAETIPALTYDKITHLEIDRFSQKVFINPQGQDIHYSLYLPPTYDKAKSYPLFYYITGNGGRLNYLQTDADGNFVSLGGPLTRDRFGIAATQLPEDAIVVLPQLWRNAPATWNNDTTADAISLLEYLLGKYSINKKRVYAAGSSFGTMCLSNVLAKRPDLISAYIQCNGTWTGSPSAFSAENSKILTGKDIAYLNALPRVTKDAAWMDKARTVMAGVVTNRVPIWVSQGVNDQTIAVTSGGVSTYEGLRALYKEQGMADADIDKLVKIHLYEDPTYLAMGVSERHANVPVAIKTNPDLFTWALAIGK